MKKRIFSTLLALCMLLCLMPTAAFAEDSAEEPPVCSCETACTAESMNKDCPVCGAEGALPENCAQCAQPADDAAAQPMVEVSDPQPETALTALIGGNETAKEVSNADELTAAIADVNVDTVKLTGDISISNSLTVNRTVTLDLNGHVLKYVSANEGSVIVVEGSGNLTLTDSNTTAKHKFMPNGKLWVLDEENGKETVTGGVITGGTGKPIQFGSGEYVYYAYYGGGVYIAPGGQLTMTGGNIIGCSATDGGGVCADPLTNQTSQFSMSGGSIAGCVATDIGGGVRASGTFKMSGKAVIRSCTAESATQFVCGGGVYVDGSSSFEMSNEAKIEGCQAISTSSNSSNGGGVYVSSSSSFVMSDEYKDFSGVEAAMNAVVRDKNITKQSEVDKMAKAIEDALAALQYKDADKTTPAPAATATPAPAATATPAPAATATPAPAATATPQHTIPQTGDTSNPALLVVLMLVSGSAAIGTAVVGSKKKHNR